MAYSAVEYVQRNRGSQTVASAQATLVRQLEDTLFTIIQIDFPFTGPFGEAAATAFRGLAEDIAETPGLRWKVWTEHPDTGRAGGIYLFEDEAPARAYLAMHRERLAGFGIAELRAEVLHVNEALSRIDRAPLG